MAEQIVRPSKGWSSLKYRRIEAVDELLGRTARGTEQGCRSAELSSVVEFETMNAVVDM